MTDAAANSLPRPSGGSRANRANRANRPDPSDRSGGQSLDIGSILVRLCSALAISVFAVRAGVAYTRSDAWSDRIPLLLLVVAEVITASLILMSKPAQKADRSLQATIVTGVATFSLFFVNLVEGPRLAPLAVTTTLQVIAIAVQIVSKLTLGRCFGLLPARRGIVTAGPYRYLRHPIYFGYLLGHIGFLLSRAHVTNFVVYLVQNLVQARRTILEERVLSEDPEYREYQTKTRYRIVPGLF